MKPGPIRRRGSIEGLALFAILLVALAPTVSQVAASLRHAAKADGHAAAMTHAHARAGHAADNAPSHATAHADHGAAHAETDGAPPEDCWSACGYCDLFGHVPALELPAATALIASALPAPVVESVRRIFVDAIQRRLALPRGPPLPLV